jgi:hypothetical protein
MTDWITWNGGDKAPTDWDGGPVLLRDGTEWSGDRVSYWTHGTRAFKEHEIVGYHRKRATMDLPRWAFDRAYALRDEMQRRYPSRTILLDDIAAYLVATYEPEPADPDEVRARDLFETWALKARADAPMTWSDLRPEAREGWLSVARRFGAA